MVVQRGLKGGFAVVAGTCAGVVLCTLTAAGCSGQGAVADEMNAAEARAVVRQAADVLARSGTSRARTSMEMDSGGTRVTIHGVGVFDYGRRTGRLRVALPAEAAGGEQREPIVELIGPGALYMKNRGAGVPDGKWVRVDTTTLPDGNLVTGGATDPVSAAELLRGARAVSFRGEVRMDGETVRHYRGTTDIVVAARAASPRSREQLAAAAEGLRRAVPFDAYIDGQGRLRKVSHRFAFSPGAGGTGGAAPDGAGRNDGPEGGQREEVSVTSTTRLYDFGAPAVVTMPEPDDIYTGRIAAP